MSSPAVVIEMVATDEASPYAPLLVSACSEGLRNGGQCALAAPKGDASPAVAVVAWDDEGHLAVRVEVGVRRGERSEWLTRPMTFHASDVESERWRAVGLVIATLVGEVNPAPEAHSVTASPLPMALAPPPVPPSSAPPIAPGPRRWSFDIGFDLSRGTSDALGARGGSIRASHRIFSSLWSLTSSLRYEIQPSATTQLDLAWGWATFGVALTPLSTSHLSIDARLEPTMGFLRASFTGPTRVDQARFLVGLREELAATLWLTDGVGLSVGAAIDERPGRAVVRLVPVGAPASAEVTEQPLGWSTVFAARFRLNR